MWDIYHLLQSIFLSSFMRLFGLNSALDPCKQIFFMFDLLIDCMQEIVIMLRPEYILGSNYLGRGG